MKRALILAVVVLMMFSFMFTGCSTGTVALTDEDVSEIALASLGLSMIPLMCIELFPDNGTYTDAEPEIVSGTLTVLDGTYTFTACAVDVDEEPDGTADMTLGGAFSVEVDLVEETMTFTYSAFNLIGTLGITSISATSTGTLTVTTETFNVDITISGITAAAHDVVVVMPVPIDPGPPTEVTSTTIDGVDYTAEFITALADIIGG